MELLRSELENYVPRMHVDCWNGSCICEIQEAFEIRVGARIQNIHILLRCPDVFGLHSLCSFHLRWWPRSLWTQQFKIRPIRDLSPHLSIIRWFWWTNHQNQQKCPLSSCIKMDSKTNQTDSKIIKRPQIQKSVCLGFPRKQQNYDENSILMGYMGKCACCSGLTAPEMDRS